MLALLFRAQLRFAYRAPLSTLSAILGLTLGIASVVAVHLICERIVASLDEAIPVYLQPVTHIATRPELADEHYFRLRKRWRAGELSEVRALVPLLQGQITTNDQAGIATRLQVHGVDWLALDQTAAGTSAGATSRPVIGPLSAQVLVNGGLEWPVGSAQRVAGEWVQVAGTVGGDSGLPVAPALYGDIALAVKLLGSGSARRLSAVLLQVEDPLAGVRRLLSNLLPGVEAGLPPPVAPRLGGNWQVRALASELPEQSFGRSVLFNLGALGTLSLVVAWFLMLQTALLWLRRQQRVFRLLRDQGVGRGAQLLVFALAMLFLGLLAGLLGVWLGSQLASSLMANFGAQAAGQSPAFEFSTWLWLKAVVSALAVPLLSALVAFRLSHSDDVSVPNWSYGWRWSGVAAAALLTTWLLLRPESGLFGAFAAILLACVVAIALLLPLLRRLRERWLLPSTQAQGLSLRMGARELLWYPAELGVALGALSLAVATSIGIGTMVDSFRLDFVRMLDQRLADDIGIEGPAANLLRLQDDLSVRAPDDLSLRVYARARTRIEGQPVVLGRNPMDLSGAARYGLGRVLQADELMLNQRAARVFDRKVGEALTVAGQRLRIAHIYPGYGDAELRGLIGTQTPALVAADGGLLRFDLYRIGLQTANAEALSKRLHIAYPNLRVTLRAEARTRAVAIFDRTFAITRSLTLVALLVATVGLYSAMVALGLTQAHTRTLLVYLGQRRTDHWLYLCGRALAVGFVTLIIAVPLGLLLGAMLCYVVNPRGFGWAVPMTLQWTAIGMPTMLALVAAFAAGVMGDRRELA